MRIGFGYDVHKLVKGKKLVLGGVEIKHAKGLLGWSDADVLLHAIIDSIIGALGEGDIGKHFPAGNKKYKGISSIKLLEYIVELMREKGYAVNNIDAVIVAQEPKIAPYVEKMKNKIALALDIKTDLLNIKGKTEEGLGFTGSKKGIAAYAVCLMHKEI
jgi:2-C-methyl-D-erythritol 2,4-cyclodiphosphate synthase